MKNLAGLSRIKDFVSLARLDKPIGTLLLFWPTMSALWLASGGIPDTHILIVFGVGVILMRSAGCVINDYADRHFDGHVRRTAHRVIACGQVSKKEALTFFIALVIPAFLLVLTTNILTICLSFIGVILASLYPFAKRHTYLPQVILGIAYSWSAPMAFAAVSETVTPEAWLLLTANLLWVVAYDTQYAMIDRDDDLKLGIKSTAILFGDLDNMIIGLLQFLFIISLAILGLKTNLSIAFYLSLLSASALFISQHLMTKERQRDQCFRAFINNHWVGLIIFLGIIMAQ